MVCCGLLCFSPPVQAENTTLHWASLGDFTSGEEWKFVKQSDVDVISVYNTSFLQLDLKVNSAHSKPQ